MWALVFENAFLSLFFFPWASAIVCPTYGNVVNELGMKLSPGSSISNNATSASRWSLYRAPTPSFVVHVASESDVATSVRHEPYTSNDGY